MAVWLGPSRPAVRLLVTLHDRTEVVANVGLRFNPTYVHTTPRLFDSREFQQVADCSNFVYFVHFPGNCSRC